MIATHELTDSQWASVFALLGAMAAADGRAFDAEIDTAHRLIVKLAETAHLHPLPTRDELEEWVRVNLVDMDARISAGEGRAWLVDHLVALSGSALREDIYRALEEAACADHELDRDEYRVLIQAAGILNVTPSTEALALKHS